MRTIPELGAPLAAALRPALSDVADEILTAIRSEVPEYDRVLQGEFGAGVRVGVVDALARFLDVLEDPANPAPPPGIYQALGRGELRQGRSLDALQAAYRTGARVAWRRLSAEAEQAGIPVATQHALAEAIFAYIDELASESVEGYAQAQAQLAGERQRRRQVLLSLLLGGEPLDTATLRRAALEAAWPVPTTVVVLACSPGQAERVARAVSADALHGSIDTVGCVVSQSPAELPPLDPIAAELRTRIGVGPVVPAEQAPRSLDWAARALRLPGGPDEAVVAADRLVELVTSALPDVLTELRAQVLAPLDDETPASRERLVETLRSWLRHDGRRAAIAEELHVHPQTVRYRVARLRELLGDALDDPDERFAMELALR